MVVQYRWVDAVRGTALPDTRMGIHPLYRLLCALSTSVLVILALGCLMEGDVSPANESGKGPKIVGLRLTPAVPTDGDEVSLWLNITGMVVIKEVRIYLDGTCLHSTEPDSTSVTREFSLGKLQSGHRVLDVVAKGSASLTTAHRDLRVLRGADIVTGVPSSVVPTEDGEKEAELIWQSYETTQWKEGLWQTETPFFSGPIGAAEKPASGVWLCGVDTVHDTTSLVHVDLARNRSCTLDVTKATGMREVYCIAVNFTGEVCIGFRDGLAWFDEKSFTWSLYPVGSPGILGPVRMAGFDHKGGTWGSLWVGGYVEPDGPDSEDVQGWVSVYDGKSGRTWTDGFLYPYAEKDRVPLPPVREIAFDWDGEPVILTADGVLRYTDAGGFRFVGHESFEPPFDAPASEIYYDRRGHAWLIASPLVSSSRDFLYYRGDPLRRVGFPTDRSLHQVHEGLGRIWVVGTQAIYSLEREYGEEAWKNAYVDGGPHSFLFDYDGRLYFTSRFKLLRFDYDTYVDRYMWGYEVDEVG